MTARLYGFQWCQRNAGRRRVTLLEHVTIKSLLPGLVVAYSGMCDCTMQYDCSCQIMDKSMRCPNKHRKSLAKHAFTKTSTFQFCSPGFATSGTMIPEQRYFRYHIWACTNKSIHTCRKSLTHRTKYWSQPMNYSLSLSLSRTQTASINHFYYKNVAFRFKWKNYCFLLSCNLYQPCCGQFKILYICIQVFFTFCFKMSWKLF